MNALDIHMSFVQMLIIVVGPMMLLADGGKDFLSWIIMLFTISVGVCVSVLIAVKGLQWLTKNRSPLSWAFDVYLDHHGGPGASTARTLHLMLLGYFRKGKFFYDVDSYSRNGSVGVIMDAAKLSRHICVCLGSETWSRVWSVAAICSAHQWRVQLSVLSFAETVIAGQKTKSRMSFRSIYGPDADLDEVYSLLAKKAPMLALRPYGLGDAIVPAAMQTVFKAEDIEFASDTQQSVETAMKSLLSAMSAVPLVAGVSRESPYVSNKFFSADPSSMNSAVCLSCDHADPEAISVSRLFGYLLGEVVAESSARPGGATGVTNLSFMQDFDLDPASFAGMVKGGKVPAVVVIITAQTYRSTPQLLRLGFQQQYNTAGFRPHPIAICEIFSVPDAKVMDDIKAGKVLALGRNSKEAVKAFLTEDISLTRVVLALIQVLESRVFLCNCPIATENAIKVILTNQVVQVSQALGTAPKPVPKADAAQTMKDGSDDMMCAVPTQQHRYMKNYFAAEQSTSVPEAVEELVV
jgi:hypothetical protein